MCCTKLYAFLVGILRSNHIAEIMTLMCMLAINVETGKLYKRGKYGLRFFFPYYEIQDSLFQSYPYHSAVGDIAVKYEELGGGWVFFPGQQTFLTNIYNVSKSLGAVRLPSFQNVWLVQTESTKIPI